MTVTADDVIYGGEVVELAKEVIVDTEDVSGSIKARDKRSGLVDRTRKMRQVLCYICCAEFGTTSLKIHQKTCLKKHIWGLDLVEHEEGIPKKQAALNRKKCTEPGSGTLLPLPTVKCKAKDFDDYNEDVLAIFTAHSAECLYCRERNHEAIENAQHAAQAAYNKLHADEDAKRKHDEEEEARHQEEEAARLLLEEERLRHALEEEEAHRKAEEEAEAHRLAEEEAARRHAAEVAAMEEAARKRAEEAATAAKRAAEAEAARREAAEKARREALAAAEDEARRAALEEQHRREEEEGARLQALAAEEALNKPPEEDDDAKMMRLLKEEEAQRREAAEENAREKKRIAMGQHKYLKKHDGVLAASQSGACYQDKKADERAKEDMAHMSIAHAKHENLIHEHHKVGGESFHDSHSSKVVMVEVEVEVGGGVA